MSKQRVRGSSVLLGSLFIVCAVSALLGQFNDIDRAKAVVPVVIVTMGIVTIANGIRTFLSRD
jgi:ribose/xylose/arabinose/galactoside ABC-type transport system permease subunit